MTPPRIGIDARLRAYRGGGIATHVTCLIEGLAALPVTEELLVLSHRREVPRAAPLPVKRLLTPPHHVLEGWTVPLELAGLRLDLLHAPDFIVPRAWRARSVATVHDLAFLRWPDYLSSDSLRYYRQVRRVARTADLIIAVSEHTRRELISLVGADPARIRVVPNAVPPRFLERHDATPDSAALLRCGVRPPFILFVSTIEPRKNITTLLEAHRALLDEGRREMLVLAGADGWRADLVRRRVAELRLGDHVRFTGYVADHDLPELYRAAALLAHPALDEGFGLTPLEAMACGTPVVVSDAGSLPEVVGNAALRVDPRSPRDWAAALARVLDTPSLARELGRAGRQRARAYTLERMARGTLGVYREALGRTPVRESRA